MARRFEVLDFDLDAQSIQLRLNRPGDDVEVFLNVTPSEARALELLCREARLEYGRKDRELRAQRKAVR